MAKAKTLEDIVKALTGALEQGEGDLDDLDSLLTKVKADIVAAKKAEEEAKKEEEAALIKRGEAIAAMATRVLENKVTDDDVAMVMEAYLKGKGFKNLKISGAEVAEAMTAALDMQKHLDEFVHALGDFFSNPKKEEKSQTADDILRDFLKHID